MPTYTFDFNLQAWIQNVEIEAESYEEAVHKLNTMDIDDLISEGYVKRYDIDDVDCESDEDDYEEEDEEDDDFLDDEEDIENKSLTESVKTTNNGRYTIKYNEDEINEVDARELVDEIESNYRDVFENVKEVDLTNDEYFVIGDKKYQYIGGRLYYYTK